MQEKIRKNFVLLSKIAKEKKYAQEYLGLLARRGDIGSIRIGKRWYTTWQWFEEFLENLQKKKEVAGEVQAVKPVKIEAKKQILPSNEKEEVKISVPFVFPEREKVFAVRPAQNVQREQKISGQPAKISVVVKTRQNEIAGRKNIAVGMGEIRRIGEVGKRRERKMMPKQPGMVRIGISSQKTNGQLLPHPRMETKFRNISVAERNKHAIPYTEIKFRKKADVFSPDLSDGENIFAPVFGRFAFAMSFALILLLISASGYFVYSGGLLKKGIVAGASDERNGGFPGIKSGSEYVLTSAGDKIKESLSISKVIVQAAIEKSTNSGQ